MHTDFHVRKSGRLIFEMRWKKTAETTHTVSPCLQEMRSVNGLRKTLQGSRQENQGWERNRKSFKLAYWKLQGKCSSQAPHKPQQNHSRAQGQDTTRKLACFSPAFDRTSRGRMALSLSHIAALEPSRVRRIQRLHLPTLCNCASNSFHKASNLEFLDWRIIFWTTHSTLPDIRTT